MNEQQLPSRAKAIVGKDSVISWSFTPSGIPTDVVSLVAWSFYKFSPLTTSGQTPLYSVLPSAVNHMGTGLYQCVLPAQDSPGILFDEVSFIPPTLGPPLIDVGQVFIDPAQPIQDFKSTQEMRDFLRTLVRDADPEHQAHFSPPDLPTINVNFDLRKMSHQYNWQEWELDTALVYSSMRMASVPPTTAPALGAQYQSDPYTLFGFAQVTALRQMLFHFARESFDYSVASLSMTLTQFDKYQAILDKLEDSIAEQYATAKKLANLCTRGILNPRRAYSSNLPARGVPASSNLRQRWF